MNTLRQMFEDFGDARSPSPKQPTVKANEPDLEGLRLEAFENGYRAGWDDAIKAQSDDDNRISSGLGSSLQELSFTYHEATAQVMNAMTPLLEEMVRVLLPELARAALGTHIQEQLTKLAGDIGALDVEIAVSPGNAESVGPLLDDDFGFPVKLVEDATLSAEQADIRFGQTEKQIDLSDLVASVSEAVAGFAHDNRRKLTNG